MKLSLKLKCTLENITTLSFNDTADSDYPFMFKIKCSSCREVHPKNVVIEKSNIESTDKKGSANFVYTCACGSKNNLSIASGPLEYTEDDDRQWKVVATFEARGMQFEEFIPHGTFTAVTTTGQKFDDVELGEEWYEMDEKTMEPVSITDIEWQC